MSFVNLKNFCNVNNIGFYYYDQVTSTMDVAKNIKNTKNKAILVIANSQTAGKGRRKNIWISEKGNVYFTLRFFPKNIYNIHLIGLISCLNIKKTFQYFNIGNIFFKWPNDIYINTQKVSGILVETYSDYKEFCCLLGIGVNFNSSPSFNNYETTYLKKYNTNINKESLIENLIKNIFNSLNKLNNKHNFNLINLYKKSLMYIGKKIIVFIENQDSIVGTFTDITNDGYIIVKSNNKDKIITTGSIALFND